MNNDILTIEEVASYLRVSERTVYEWANKGEIPCGKLGTSWRFKRSEIEKWVDSQLGSEKKESGNFVPLFIDRLLDSEHIMVVDSISKNELLEKMVEMIKQVPVELVRQVSINVPKVCLLQFLTRDKGLQPPPPFLLLLILQLIRE